MRPQIVRHVLYVQVYTALAQRITGGDWKPGAPLPNEQELARDLGVSTGTVRKALEKLEADHLIERRQGRGTFVLDNADGEHAIRFANIRDRTVSA